MGLARNKEALRELAAMLADGRFMTATQIAMETSCSRTVAYSRLQALRDKGCAFQTKRVRQGRSGPMAIGYALLLDQSTRFFVDYVVRIE